MEEHFLLGLIVLLLVYHYTSKRSTILRWLTNRKKDKARIRELERQIRELKERDANNPFKDFDDRLQRVAIDKAQESSEPGYKRVSSTEWEPLSEAEAEDQGHRLRRARRRWQ